MRPATRVIVNARFLDQPVTGVQRFALEICRDIDRALAERNPAMAHLSFAAARPQRAAKPFPFRHIEELRFGRLGGQAWEQIELPWHARSAVLVNLCNLCPVLGRHNVTVVHDANVWLIPDNYSLAFRLAYRILVPLGLRQSKAWITVSQYSADRLLALGIANRPADAVIGNGSDHVRSIDGCRSKLAQAGLPRPFVFAVGSRSRNKNVGLIRSLAPELGAAGISIVIAGDAGSPIFAEQGGGHQRNLIELGRIDDEDLAFLFRNCLCFLFPSFFEGFGIPPIEAMALGAAVISSNTSSLPEVLGEAALYCPPDKPSAWIDAIKKVSGNKHLRDDLISRGLRQASKYRWRNSAERLLHLVAQLTRQAA